MFFIFILFFPLQVFSNNIDPDILSTQCKDIEGSIVYVIFSNNLSFDPLAGSTMDEIGFPVIIFNPLALENISNVNHAQMFVFFHECGHHRLGHVKRYTTGPKRKLEHDADCYAVRKFIQKYGKQLFFRALEDLRTINSPFRESLILSCLQ